MEQAKILMGLALLGPSSSMPMFAEDDLVTSEDRRHLRSHFRFQKTCFLKKNADDAWWQTPFSSYKWPLSFNLRTLREVQPYLKSLIYLNIVTSISQTSNSYSCSIVVTCVSDMPVQIYLNWHNCWCSWRFPLYCGNVIPCGEKSHFAVGKLSLV